MTVLAAPPQPQPQPQPHPQLHPRRTLTSAVYGLLDPIPLGCFMAALIFDAVYARSGETLWVKGASWLIAIGLVFAVVPRLINFVQVWFTGVTQVSDRHGPRTTTATDRVDFWLKLLAIAAAIVNAFIHTRDAYAVVPAGVLLSACTVLLMSAGNVLLALRHTPAQGPAHA